MIVSDEVRQLSRKCHVPGCGASSPTVVVYSTRKSKNEAECQRWARALGLSEDKNAVHACQRHFPAGVATKNHPDPNPNLFNPIPKQTTSAGTPTERTTSVSSAPIFNHAIDGTLLGPDGKPLPTPVKPPPGSVKKIARHATLIDLNKIKKDQDPEKPFRIEEVTVIIDDKDTVKVVDYGSKDSIVPSPFDYSPDRGRQSKVNSMSSTWNDISELEPSTTSGNEPSFHQFYESSLSNTLEQMRQMTIDCNTALVDVNKQHVVYAHRAVLIAKSPYFYRHMYLRRKKLKCLQQFCRFTLPDHINFNVVDAVVSFMYTGSMSYLLGKDTTAVQKVLSLFEMQEALDNYIQEIVAREEEDGTLKHQRKRLKTELDDELEGIVIPMLTEVDDIKTEDMTPRTISIEEPGEEKKRRRKSVLDLDSNIVEDTHGKMKVSVQKIVENVLNAFIVKVEELLDPTSTTLQLVRTSQHVITLWQADVLLSKLFDQNHLTKFFSQVMQEVIEKNVFTQQVPQTPGSYNVDVLSTQTGNSLLDDAYNKPSSEDATLIQEVETLLDGNLQIINYPQIDPQHIPKYVHMIAMYKFTVWLGRKNRSDDHTSSDKDALIPSLLEGEVLHDDASGAANDLHDLMSNMQEDDLLSESSHSITRSCFQQISLDLKRRAIADLELYVNPSFHEELIMHIVLDQMVDRNVLQISFAVFLAKGCNFCRKKECKSEDLTLPITPDNPVCPDRQCIKRNLICEICSKEMSNSKSLARHKYSVHDIQMGDQTGLFICSHCGETFSKKWKLNMHERQHEDRKLEVSCHVCQKVMKGATALKKHINMVHETKRQYPCDYCDKSFKRKETLNVHRRTHTGEKPYPCPRCDYASETKGNLKAHMWRKHKLQLVDPTRSIQDSDHHQKLHLVGADHAELHAAEHNQATTADEHTMAATLVAQPDGSFIFSAPTTDNDLVS